MTQGRATCSLTDTGTADPPLPCAWCRRRYTPTGIAEPPLPTLATDESHGVCPECFARLSGEIARAAFAGGDRLGGFGAERAGLAEMAAFLGRRSAVLVARATELQGRAKETCARARAISAGRRGG